PGVRIGHAAVVGAGSVVTRDVEPWSIVAGNPARHIRWRPERELDYTPSTW
ncbi:MAG: antibiotic acetyltransferase, partial [Actinomycetota bacterium]|nr:antibiotic acetyltransferase [Actinomycetota bacterium]